jgi:tetratricopeptide (TPR) repeat protein
MRALIVLALLGLSGCFGPKTPPEPAASGGAGSDQPAASGAPATGTAGVPTAQPAVLTEEQKAIARREKAKEASSLLTTGKFEDSRRALSLLKELEPDMPDSAPLAYNMGLAHEALGNTAMAEQAYRRATQLDPELGAAWLRLGALAEAGGDIGWALTVYGQGMRAAPEDMDLHVASIGVMVRQGRLDDAEAAARKALGINANAQDVYAYLALVYIQQGRLELGKFIIQRAFAFVDGADSNPNLHAYLGRIFYLEEHPFEARAAYEKALSLDPELLDAMLFLAEVHLDNRAYAAMVPLLEKAVKVSPDDPAIHMNLGIGYRGVGRMEDAEKEYRRVIELLPGRPEPFLNLAILYGDHQKNYDQAMQILEQYKGMAGADVALADSWVEQYVKEKERAERAEARRLKAEERRKKREEEQKFLEEFERQQKEKEEAERKAREAAEAAAASQPGASEAAAGATEAAAGATEAPADGEAAPGAPEAPADGEAAPGAPEAPAVDAPAPEGTTPAEPVSEPQDSAPEPAAPSEASPEASPEEAAGQTGEGGEPTAEEPSTPENPWGG